MYSPALYSSKKTFFVYKSMWVSHLSHFISSTENPHLTIQWGNAGCFNFGIGTIGKVYVIIVVTWILACKKKWDRHTLGSRQIWLHRWIQRSRLSGKQDVYNLWTIRKFSKQLDYRNSTTIVEIKKCFSPLNPITIGTFLESYVFSISTAFFIVDAVVVVASEVAFVSQS